MNRSVEELSSNIQWERDQFLQMDHGAYESHTKLYRTNMYRLLWYQGPRELAPGEGVPEICTAIL